LRFNYAMDHWIDSIQDFVYITEKFLQEFKSNYSYQKFPTPNEVTCYHFRWD